MKEPSQEELVELLEEAFKLHREEGIDHFDREKSEQAHSQIRSLIQRKVSMKEIEQLVQACSYCGAVSDTCKGCMDSAVGWLKNHGIEAED